MRWLLLKDLQMVRRSPLLCGLLVVYPIVLALIVGAAFSSPPAKPTVAFVDQVAPGAGSIAVGGQRLDIADYTSGLLRSVHAIRERTPAAAIADVRSGRALAAVVVPADLPHEIESLITEGVGTPTVHVYLNTRNPLERRSVEQVLQARIAGAQSEVSRRVLRVAVGDLQRVLAGGTVTLLGRSVHLLGLRDSRAIVQGTIASLPRRSPLRVALGQVSVFASVAIAGLGFAKPVLGSIGSPLTVTQTQIAGATTPTSVYAVAIAVVVVLMVVAMLLAAGALALEWEEGTYVRLTRGLVTPGRLLAEKALFAGAGAAVLAFVMAAAVSAFVALQWSRVGLWAAAVVLGGLAFAALGVVIGTFAREVAAASLMAFVLALPLAFAGLVPASAVSPAVHGVLSAISFCFPFRATLDAAANAFSGAAPGPALALAHLAVLAAVYATLARLAARARAAA